LKIITLSKANIKKRMAELLKIDVDQFTSWGTVWQKENFLYELPLKFKLSGIAIENNNVVGFLIASNKHGTAHIHRIAVKPGSTGKNIGSKILDFLEKKAKKKKLNKISAETLRKDQLINFYAKNGFKKMTFKEQLAYAQGRSPKERREFLKKSVVIFKDL